MSILLYTSMLLLCNLYKFRSGMKNVERVDNLAGVKKSAGLVAGWCHAKILISSMQSVCTILLSSLHHAQRQFTRFGCIQDGVS